MANEAVHIQPRANGRFVPATDRRELTERQAAFVSAYLHNGGNGTKAAVAAGYAPGSASQAADHTLGLPWVQRALEVERSRMLAKAGVKAIHLVVQILDDERAGLPLRLKAAEIALKADGRERDSNRKAEQSKALNEMSVDELEAFIRRGREAAHASRAPIIEGHSDPSPEPQSTQVIDIAEKDTV